MSTGEHPDGTAPLGGDPAAPQLATDPPLIVALAGFGSEEARERSREAGFDHHLVKPVDPDQLNRLLATPEPAAVR